MGFCIYSASVVFVMLLLATLLGSMQTSAECVYVFNKFSVAPLCSTCLSRGFWMWLCSAEKAFDEPCENACSTSLSVQLFFFFFEKVVHIIHQQGHTVSSHLPLIHTMPVTMPIHANYCQSSCLSLLQQGSSPSSPTAVWSSVPDADTCCHISGEKN